MLIEFNTKDVICAKIILQIYRYMEKLLYFCKLINQYINYTNTLNMKKSVIAVCIIIVFAVIAGSCTHHTCPAYRGSISEVVVE